MANIVNKTFLSQMTIDVGTDTYTSAIRDPAFVPTTPEAAFVDASGSSTSFVGASTWVFTATLAQDWTTGGLAKMWLTNEGQTAVIKVKLPGTQGVFTATVTLKAPQIGGPTNAVAESPIAFPVVGKPVWSAS